MYLIKNALAVQGRIIIKICELETGEDVTLAVGKEFLPPFVSPDTKDKTIDCEEFDALYEMSLVTEAVLKALNALSYGNLSRRALVSKLTAKYRIEKEYAEAAADYAVRHRYIDEASQAQRIAQLCVKTKKQGKKKAAAYLMSKGYGSETVKEAVNSVDESDYEEAAYHSLLKKTKTPPETKEEKYKLANTLARQGHSKSHIEKAFERLSGE